MFPLHTLLGPNGILLQDGASLPMLLHPRTEDVLGAPSLAKLGLRGRLLLGRQVRLQNTGATRKKDVRTVSSASLCGRRVSLGQEGISEGSEQDEVLGRTLQSPRPQSAVSSTH